MSRALTQHHVHTAFHFVPLLRPIVPKWPTYGNIDLGQHWLMLWLCAALVKYGFLYSIEQTKCTARRNCTQLCRKHTAQRLAETRKLRFYSKSHSFWDAWTTIINTNNMCDGEFGRGVPIANHIIIWKKPPQAKPSHAVIFWTHPRKLARLGCIIWSCSPMPCEKHGPSRQKTRPKADVLSLLRPEGHVFHTAWESMIKSYHSTLADWFFPCFIHINMN